MVYETIFKEIEKKFKELIEEFIEYLEWVRTKAISYDTKERIEFKIAELETRIGIEHKTDAEKLKKL